MDERVPREYEKVLKQFRVNVISRVLLGAAIVFFAQRNNQLSGVEDLLLLDGAYFLGN